MDSKSKNILAGVRILHARIGIADRDRVEVYAAHRHLILSDAIRELAIVGAGGTVADAGVVNEAAQVYRENRAMALESGQTPGSGRKDPGVAPSGRVRVRLPGRWADRIAPHPESQKSLSPTAGGGQKPSIPRGLTAAIRSGLERLTP